RTGDASAARPHLERSAALADDLGMHPLAEQARALLRQLEPMRSGAAPEAFSVSDSAPPASVRNQAGGFSLTRRGEAWLVRYQGRSFSVRDMRGMQLLARLAERPGVEVHVLALSGDDAQELGESSAGDMLDAPARDAYRRRLRDIEAALDEAQANTDAGRLERLRHERQQLVQELSRAVGLGGRARQAGSATERARVNVQKRLKQAIARIASVDTEAGSYLEQAIRTGAFCSFRP
ncbi:MAG TPA: hypothetical protein VNN80_06405, partial [Polyangiaceae bacterium]|nr:hypothetical protein [Polyangiaceae bacterium]